MRYVFNALRSTLMIESYLAALSGTPLGICIALGVLGIIFLFDFFSRG